jgi:uracil-DNA glycosylase family 4
MTNLNDLHQRINNCTGCGLHATRVHAVPGEGSDQAQVIFVGEGPGSQEDRQGRPFVGLAGQFLDKMLASVGLKRENVYITNIVKCRPPNNRDPFPGEIAACSKYLDEQIELIRPKVIIPLGRHALANWFPGESIGKVRAKARNVNGQTLFPLYHPAAALHNGSLRSTIEKDFKGVAALLSQAAAPSREKPPESSNPQLNLLDGPQETSVPPKPLSRPTKPANQAGPPTHHAVSAGIPQPLRVSFPFSIQWTLTK